MSLHYKPTIIPRLLAVIGITLCLASFTTKGVNEPSIVKVMKRLDSTEQRVTENEDQIQQILDTKYKSESTNIK